jgi:hypothetical protein
VSAATAGTVFAKIWARVGIGIDFPALRNFLSFLSSPASPITRRGVIFDYQSRQSRCSYGYAEENYQWCLHSPWARAHGCALNCMALSVERTPLIMSVSPELPRLYLGPTILKWKNVRRHRWLLVSYLILTVFLSDVCI